MTTTRLKHIWRRFPCQAMSMRCALLVFFLAVSTTPTPGQVRVWEGVLNLPAYEEGAPDPNPSFDQFAIGRFSYPYTLRKEITDQRVEHQWRAIYLENEYLKCSVLPDLGGHIHTCIDKISGQPMFYANPSIKKARIGYRGAWAAFGVEFNFPVSHNWVSMSPVDFAYAAHEDGSASITVGNIDRVYGMEWSVELSLRPSSTVLEQRVTLSNRSDERHRFYWWSNAAVQVWDDSQIQYPMRFAAAHGFVEVQRWPIDSQGKDLSIIGNQTDGPVSLFVHGSRENFMGVWHPRTNTGTVHFADYAALPAKKIWSWGVDADGLDWRKTLSDNNSAYVELQAGLFRNQETYAFLEPRQHIVFTEYWMPVRDTGGISRANLAGVVHLERKGGLLRVSFNANRRLLAAAIRILDEDTSVLSEKGDLSPERLWKKEILVPNESQKYTFEIRSSEGVLLLRQTEGEYDWQLESEIKVGPQISYAIPDETRRTEDDWLQQGRTEELNGSLLSALHTYQKALVRFPADFELLKAAGRLDASLKRFEEAVPHLAAAHDRNTTDAEISYYLGIAYEGVEREHDAVDAYQSAMRLPSYRAAAALRLAELQARRAAWQQAKDSLKESLQSAPEDLRATEELTALSRTLKNGAEGEILAGERLARFPLSDFLREELGEPNLAHLAADPYRVLNVASEYARLGLYHRAVEVLSREYPAPQADQTEPGTIAAQNHPLVVYFRGYCREKLGESAANDYLQASRLSTAYIFPNTFEERQALKAAIRANDRDATAHYLLGTWYFARDKTDEALNEWQKARKLDPKIKVLDASLGLALLRSKRDFTGALSAFEEGIKNDPMNVVNYFGTVAAMTLLEKSPAERVKILGRYPDRDRMPTGLVYELALNRAEEGNYSGAIDLFRNRFFSSEEGGTNVRQVWVEVKLQQAVELSRSGHCGEALATARALGSPVAGLSFTEDGLQTRLHSARTSYLLGGVFSGCGQKEEADRRYRFAAESSDDSDIAWAWASAKKLSGYDADAWQKRLSLALSRAESHAQTSANPGWWVYSAGVLQLALGRDVEGKASLREALLLPENQMSHHFSSLALGGVKPR
jgi:tetratricopeptide (TPR) repeat protein